MDPRHAAVDGPADGTKARSVVPGRRVLRPVQALWLGLWLPSLCLFVLASVARYAQLRAPSATVQAGLADIGLSGRSYALYLLTLSTVFALGCFVVAATILWRRPDDRMACFVGCFLVVLAALHGHNAAALEERYPLLFVPVRLGFFFVVASHVLLLFVFPDGRFVPRRLRLPLILWMAWLLVGMLTPAKALADGPGVSDAVMLTVALVAGIAAQIYRYLRLTDRVGRQQTKWVVFGVAAAALGFVLIVLPGALWPALNRPGRASLLFDLIAESVATIAFLFVPLSLGVAILRFRLWDVDILIGRTLVYGALTASTVGIYATTVGGLGALLQSRGDAVVAILATGLIAVIFQPLRARLQRAANRLLYGDRDDPYTVLSRLGRRLEGTLAPDAVLPAIVRGIAEALKLPYAAIALCRGESLAVVAATGTLAGEPVRIPLTYGAEPVGELLLAPRTPGENFSTLDRRLLGDLARQVGVAAHAARLTDDLQRARERLVTAREEERRLLRRDLHDGLGAQLAALGVQAGVLRGLIARDPAAAQAGAAELGAELRAAVADIRRLVQGLRPAALDELGLVAALRQRAAQYGAGGYLAAMADGPTGAAPLEVFVEASEALPTLPAAVEVAAYRIVEEALTNVVRHAGARRCAVLLAVDAALCLTVEDDGAGIGQPRGQGVGLISMRERAAELGGTFSIGPGTGGGTRIEVWLPLPEPEG